MKQQGVTLDIAIIGCGQIADSHILESRRIDGTNIVGVCDLNKHLAKQAALRFNITHHFTDVEKLLKETKPDVVHITTPPRSHFSLGQIVLKRGIHVYMEKPFTTNLSEAEELIATANKMGKLICAGHNAAFDPAMLRLKKLTSKGNIGNIVHLDSLMGYNLDGPFGAVFMNDPYHWLHKLPGGLAQNNISHPISLILSQMPGKVTVQANGFRFRKQQFNDIRDTFFDEVRALLVSENITGQLIFTSRCRPVQTYLRALGTDGVIYASMDSRTVTISKGANMPGPFAKLQWAYREAKESNRELYGHVKNMLTANLHYMEGMKELLNQFYRAIQGKQSMPIPMEETLRVTDVMDQIINQCNANDPR